MLHEDTVITLDSITIKTAIRLPASLLRVHIRPKLEPLFPPMGA
jgi:hypothetical protein